VANIYPWFATVFGKSIPLICQIHHVNRSLIATSLYQFLVTSQNPLKTHSSAWFHKKGYYQMFQRIIYWMEKSAIRSTYFLLSPSPLSPPRRVPARSSLRDGATWALIRNTSCAKWPISINLLYVWCLWMCVCHYYILYVSVQCSVSRLVVYVRVCVCVCVYICVSVCVCVYLTQYIIQIWYACLCACVRICVFLRVCAKLHHDDSWRHCLGHHR